MTIDLTELTKGEVRSLIGYSRGERARKHFQLDLIDRQPGTVEVRAPENLRTVTPSFVQGFFGNSILDLGEAEFRRKYQFVGLGERARQSVEAGINRVLMKRDFVPSAA
jgi:hypothetical protein